MISRYSRCIFVIGALITICIGADVPIGLVIENNRQTEISAVKYAVEFANANILSSTNTLVLNVYTTNPNLTVDAIQKTCHLISAGSVVQIGPASSSLVGAVAPYLERFKIPLMAPVATSPLLSSFNYTMHMVPSDKEQGRVIASIMTKMAWKRTHILSSDDEYGLFGLISFIEIGSSKGWHIASMQSFQSIATAPNVSSQLEVIKHSGFRLTILHCLDWQAKHILNEAKKKQMTGQGWLWIVTDGSTNTANFLPAQRIPDYMRGIIGTGFPTTSGDLMAQFQTLWAGLDPTVYPGAGNPSITTSVARWADAVFAVAYAIRDYGGTVAVPIGLNCFGGSSHSFGPTLLAEIQKVIFMHPYVRIDAWMLSDWVNACITDNRRLSVVQPGVAQDIAFTGTYPTNVQYDVYNSRSTGWTKIAIWDPTSFYQVAGTESIILPGNLAATPDFISSMNGKHFMIVTVFEQPFWFYDSPPKDPYDVQMGTELIGYGADMTMEIARILNFTFTTYMVPDGNWGGKDLKSGVWNGMVGELVAKKADFAIATFTISNIREQDMDFSTPYIDIGLRVAIPKDSVRSDPWEFATPFHPTVWVAVIVTMLIVGLVIAFMEKLSPYGLHGEFIHTNHDLDKIKPYSKYGLPQQTSFRRDRTLFRRQRAHALTAMRTDNSVWFSIASLIQQGYEFQPQALSSRLVAMLWWFGVLAIIAMYTAQLGAGLISSMLQSQINTIAELYAQDRIQYGYNKDSSIEQFFCDNELSLYKNMCRQVRIWQSHTTGTNAAIARLADPSDPYAFIWDSPVIDDIVEKKPCNLRKLGELFNKGGFGVGMQKGSQYNEIISQTILQLRENSYMDKIYDKWFTQRSECGSENRIQTETEQNTKGYKDLKGVFDIILYSALISPCLILVEFTFSCFEYYKRTSDAGMPMSFLAVVSYRIGRMGRDVYIYMIPESWKPGWGLHEYTTKRQHELWYIHCQEHQQAVMETDRQEQEHQQAVMETDRQELDLYFDQSA